MLQRRHTGQLRLDRLGLGELVGRMGDLVRDVDSESREGAEGGKII